MAVRKVSVGGTRKRKSPTKRRKTSRRRRISGIGKMDFGGVIMKGVIVGAGVVAGRLINSVIVKQVPTFSALESGLVQFGIGLALPLFIKGNQLVEDIGLGLMGQAIAVEAVNAGLVSGIGLHPTIGADRVSYRINGMNSRQATIAGPRSLSVINGGSQTRINGPRSLSVINGNRKARAH